MYWEAMGLAGYPASDAVEQAAQWVQWVSATATNPDMVEQNQYNLNQFWTLKAQAYEGESDLGKQQLEKLDALAHGYWSAMETRQVFEQGPGFFSWLAAKVGVDIDQSSRQAAAAQVDLANAGGAAASSRAGLPGLETFFKNSQSGSTLLRDANAIDSAAIQPLGIPVWVWGVGVAALVGMYIFGRSK